MTETADKQRFPLVGAPRFELGTSSPVRGVAACPARWREVAWLSHLPTPGPLAEPTAQQAFGHRLGTGHPGSSLAELPLVEWAKR